MVLFSCNLLMVQIWGPGIWSSGRALEGLTLAKSPKIIMMMIIILLIMTIIILL